MVNIYKYMSQEVTWISVGILSINTCVSQIFTFPKYLDLCQKNPPKKSLKSYFGYVWDQSDI